MASALDFLHEQSAADGFLSHRALNLNTIWIHQEAEGCVPYKVALADYSIPRVLGADQIILKKSAAG